MRGSDQFASVVTADEKTKMAPAVVVSTVLLLLGFVAAIGYRIVLTLG